MEVIWRAGAEEGPGQAAGSGTEEGWAQKLAAPYPALSCALAEGPGPAAPAATGPASVPRRGQQRPAQSRLPGLRPLRGAWALLPPGEGGPRGGVVVVVVVVVMVVVVVVVVVVVRAGVGAPG